MESEYERLRRAVADVLFGVGQAGRPVYVLPHDEALKAILDQAELEDRTLAGFARAVRMTLRLDEEDQAPFRWHRRYLEEHAKKRGAIPPSLPLMVILVKAAEQMHADLKPPGVSGE